MCIYLTNFVKEKIQSKFSAKKEYFYNDNNKKIIKCKFEFFIKGENRFVEKHKKRGEYLEFEEDLILNFFILDEPDCNGNRIVTVKKQNIIFETAHLCKKLISRLSSDSLLKEMI